MSLKIYGEWLESQILLLDHEVEHTKCQDMHTEAYRSLKARLRRYSDTWDTLIEFEALQGQLATNNGVSGS